MLNAKSKKNTHLPQVVRSALDTVVVPSHVASQLVAFPTDVLILFSGQSEHESPSLKYPTSQTQKKKRVNTKYII